MKSRSPSGLVLLPDEHPELFTFFCIYSISSRIAGLPTVPILKIEECQWADFLHRYRYVKPSPLAESFLFLGIKDQELHLDAWDITRIVFLGSRKTIGLLSHRQP